METRSPEINAVAERSIQSELRVASAFTGAGFSVERNGHYKLKDGSRIRRLNVVARRMLVLKDFLISVKFCCEVSESDVTLLTAPDHPVAAPARVVQRVGTRLGRELLFKLCQESTFQNLGLFQLPERPAYEASFEGRAGGEDLLCEIAAEAEAAYGDEMNAAVYSAPPSLNHGDRSCFFEILFPVVVVPGRLQECFAAGSESVTQNARRGVLVKNLLQRGPMMVDFVALDAVEEFVLQASEAVDAIFKQEPAASELMQDVFRSQLLMWRLTS